MKPLLIFIFTINFSFKLQAQIKHSLSIGYSIYTEIKSVKNFHIFDENSGKYGRGNFASLAYNIEFSQKIHLKLHTSYGYFKRQNFKLNDSTYGKAYSHMSPIKLEGSIQLMNYNYLGMGIFAGIGANWVQYNSKASSDSQSLKESKTYPLYVYGIALRLFSQNRHYMLIKVAHFDKKDFLTLDLDIPIYRFNKEKKKK